jgi:hypothetical protein
MARTGVGILVSALKGDEERKNVRIPATIISAENLALPSIRRLVGTLAPGPAKAP